MKSRLEWKVGLFVFVGLALLAVLLIQFSKGMTLFRSTYNIVMHAANVGGLKTKAQVLMSGVQVGTVSDIRLSPDGRSVFINLKVYSQYRIHQDATFNLEQSGFLGDQYVAIMPTKNSLPEFQDGGSAECGEPFNLQEVARSASGFVKRVDETARRLNETIADVRRLLLNENTLTNLATAVGNMRAVSEQALITVANLNTLITTNSPAIAQSGSNLVVFSEQLNRFADSLSGVVETNRADIRSAVANIETSTEVLKDLMKDVQAGKGLAGALIKNEQVAADVAATTRNVSITTSNLNRLGLWGILWHHKSPHGGTPEPAIPSPKNTRP